MSNAEKRREQAREIERLELTTYDKVVIWAMCRNGLNVSRATKDLYYCRSSVACRVERIKEKTGLNLKDFYDATKLLAMIGEDPQLRGLGG